MYSLSMLSKAPSVPPVKAAVAFGHHLTSDCLQSRKERVARSAVFGDQRDGTAYVSAGITLKNFPKKNLKPNHLAFSLELRCKGRDSWGGGLGG